MKDHIDTIAAVATPPGRGGLGVIRVSGPAVKAVADKLLQQLPPPRYAQLSHFYDQHGQIIDRGLALYFPSPNSFTGEDVLELQAHGGPVLLDMLLKTALTINDTRIARPGEFSQRAFLNGKMDLLQAEAVADLIDSASAAAVRSAARSLQGDFSQAINDCQTQLLQLRVFVEGAIDFPEEEIDFLNSGDVQQRLQQIKQQLHSIINRAKQGSLLREGMQVVIIGQPNVGKSSLINRLAGEELAIVSPIPGTTRDVIKQQILIQGMPVHIIDTAGIRPAQNQIEQQGIKRTRAQIQQADRVLLVTDAQQDIEQQINTLRSDLPPELPISVVVNKIDLSKQSPVINDEQVLVRVYLSAKTGSGIDLLRVHLARCAGLQNDLGETVVLARTRHTDALNRASDILQQAISQFERSAAGELLAEDLRQIHNQIGKITGEFSSEDLLGEIFSQFCIGK